MIKKPPSTRQVALNIQELDWMLEHAIYTGSTDWHARLIEKLEHAKMLLEKFG